MESSVHLGELQYRIMRVLWEQREATVAEVHAALEKEGARALTTVATMLTKMEKKGVVAHERRGRQFVYSPTVTEADVHRSMVSDLTERLFQGDVGALVNHLITEREFEPDELLRLRELIDRREAAERDGGENGRS